jgi:hypothetical protein
MASKKQDSGSKSEKKAQLKGQATPRENRQRSQARDSTKDVADQPQAQVSELEQGSGFSILDLLDVRKALRYLLSLVEPMIPERYRRKLPFCAALAVVLIGLTYSAHKYWYLIVGIPDVHLNVNNTSDEPRTLPTYVWAEIVLQSGERIDGYSMKLPPPHGQGAENGSAEVGPGKRGQMHLRHPKRANLYRIYKEGNAFLVLKFYRDAGYTDLMGNLGRIQFNEIGLTSVGLPDIQYSNGKPEWERPGICLFFGIESSADPNIQETLKEVRRELVTSAEPFCWVVTREDYEQERDRFDAYTKRSVASAGGNNTASRYQGRSLVARVNIRGWSDSRERWVFEISDAQKKIRDARVLVGCGPMRKGAAKDTILTASQKEMMFMALQRRIVRYYGIEGQIDEVIYRGPNDIEAFLNVGSYMGVRKDMVFNVLSDGIDGLSCGTVEIESIPDGVRGASGPLKAENLNELNYTKFESLRVKYTEEW